MLLAILLALAWGTPGTTPQGDPLTGVWEGRGTGASDLIPPEGFSFVLVLESLDTFEARATLTMEGVPPTAPAEAEFDPDTGELTATCNLSGVRLVLELIIDGETLTGTASGLGLRAELEGKRTSLSLPEPARVEGRSSPADLTALSSADWQQDLAFLAREIPARHANAFHSITREDWEREVLALEARIPELSSTQAAVALSQLVAQVGDAHTELPLGARPFNLAWPIRLAWFEDGLFVTAIDEQYDDALATRVLRLGRMSTEQALAAVCSTFASENDSWPRVKAPPKLAQCALLVALGIVEDERGIPLLLEGPDGEEFALTVGPAAGKLLVAPDPSLVATPLWLRRRGETYWFEPLPQEHGLYLAYNRCAEDLAHPMQDLVTEVLAALEVPGIERLVIDLRHNSGGNSLVLGRFVPTLASALAPGELHVLIGPRTYSSGTRNAQQLQEAGAHLHGEPTGGKPGSYGEVLSFTLPRSGLRVYHSTKYFGEAGAKLPAVLPDTLVPDTLVPATSADWFAGRDPVLERALGAD
jgi:hypothetical protein